MCFGFATWNNVSSKVLWDTPGAKASTDRDPTPVESFDGALGVHSICILPSVVQAWVPDSTKNYGLLIANDVDSDGINIDSSEFEIEGARPVLMVKYQDPPPL